eukprot:5112969-Karenia_brevis.AAC.1
MATSAVDVIGFNAASSGDAAAGADVINLRSARVAFEASSLLAAGRPSPVLFGSESTTFASTPLAAGKPSP